MSNIKQIKDFVESSSYKWYTIQPPEGKAIHYTNKSLERFLVVELTSESALDILEKYKSSFDIKLTASGFPKAAERSEENDGTNYDAVWVRDAIWVYYYLVEFKPNDAKILINKLCDYYMSQAQKQRFEQIIANPNLAVDKMAVPHIRFDGNSLNYDDVIIDGKPQVWNHKQMDAHGLFLLALADSYQRKTLDIKKEQLFDLLRQFFYFFDVINYSEYADAGAWEEIDRVNSSSISLVSNACARWQQLLKASDFNIDVDLNELVKKGLDKVNVQIQAGGESPLYRANDVHYRTGDAALLHLFTPFPFNELELENKILALRKIEPLMYDLGIIRYKKDSYQAGNFWFEDDSVSKESLTDDSSSIERFSERAKGQGNDSEAQWFFDSMVALAMLDISNQQVSKDIDVKDFRKKAAWHIKRALAQITAENFITADGKKVESELLPESINTIIFEDKRYYLPSPITPLNWAKASLAMALKKFSAIKTI